MANLTAKEVLDKCFNRHERMNLYHVPEGFILIIDGTIVDTGGLHCNGEVVEMYSHQHNSYRHLIHDQELPDVKFFRLEEIDISTLGVKK